MEPALAWRLDGYLQRFAGLLIWYVLPDAHGLLGVFTAFLLLAAIGVVRFVITGKRLVMNIALAPLLLFSVLFFFFFVLGRMGGAIPVILFSVLSCIVGIVGSGLSATK